MWDDLRLSFNTNWKFGFVFDPRLHGQLPTLLSQQCWQWGALPTLLGAAVHSGKDTTHKTFVNHV